MLADAPDLVGRAGLLGAIDRLLEQRGVKVVGAAEWRLLDTAEQQAGQRLGKVREKVIGPENTWAAIERARSV
jgi:hypothetical protein